MDKAQELAEQAWTAYRRGQISADHTAKDVFCEVVLGLLTAQRHAADQPPSASGERDLLARWLKWTQEFWSIRPEGVELVEQTRFLLARAALAPSPGIDAAEQKPVAWAATSEDGEVEALGMNQSRRFDTPLFFAAQPAAQPSADDPQFPFYELRFIMRVLSHQGSAPKEDWQTAYGMARKMFEQWSKERQAAEPHPPSRACMCDACKPSFENGANDPAQRHDIVRQVPGPSSEWVAEAERLADKYASANAYAEVEGATNFRLPIKNARAALLAHLRTKP